MFKNFLVMATFLLLAVPAFAQKYAEEPQFGTVDQQITFFNGGTTVQFSNEFTGALNALQIGVGRITPGPIIRRSATFPITSGSVELDTLRGEILHSGGLKLYRGSTVVKLESFIIEGVTTTIPFLARVMEHPDFQAGNVDTKFLERMLAQKAQTV